MGACMKLPCARTQFSHVRVLVMKAATGGQSQKQNPIRFVDPEQQESLSFSRSYVQCTVGRKQLQLTRTILHPLYHTSIHVHVCWHISNGNDNCQLQLKLELQSKERLHQHLHLHVHPQQIAHGNSQSDIKSSILTLIFTLQTYQDNVIQQSP